MHPPQFLFRGGVSPYQSDAKHRSFLIGAELRPDLEIHIARDSPFISARPLWQREYYAEPCRVERWSVRTLRAHRQPVVTANGHRKTTGKRGESEDQPSPRGRSDDTRPRIS